MGIDLAFNRRRINNLWNDGLICNQNPDKCTNFNNFIGASSSKEKCVGIQEGSRESEGSKGDLNF